jgi:hypothetical protein
MKFLSVNEIFDTVQPPGLKKEARAFRRLDLSHFQVERKRRELDLIHGLRLVLLNRSTVLGSVFASFHLKKEAGSAKV